MAHAFSLSDSIRSRAHGGWVRLHTLTSLRWLAVLGQSAAVAIAILVFQLDLPVFPCVIAISASIIVNVVTIQIFPATTRLSDQLALYSMLFDLIQVSAMLYLQLLSPTLPQLKVALESYGSMRAAASPQTVADIFSLLGAGMPFFSGRWVRPSLSL